MFVQLINYTPNAVETLIFTKQTRLEMTPGGWLDVFNMTHEEKMAQLDYMSNTIPSSWEFVDYIFCITGVSRAFTHQFVRTRTNSYAQQSMRVTNMEGFDYITAPGIKESAGLRMHYEHAMREINAMYQSLIAMGAPIEDARGILPTNISTNIVAKINLRTMAELARSRSGGRTQGEYREVVDAMVDCVLSEHPWAEKFLYPKGREYFDEVEQFARDLTPESDRNQLLKIIDKMRKAL